MAGEPAGGDPWRFQAATYAWAMSVSGSTTARGQTVDTNASFIDLLQRSDSLAGFMAYAEADKGPVGFYTDFVFTKLGFGSSQTSYRNPLGGLRISTTADKALSLQMFIVEMGGVYELARWTGGEGSSSALDAVGGFRYWNINLAANFDAVANIDFTRLGFDRSLGIAIARSDVMQWVDPLVGLRFRHQFTPQQQITLRADIGGFDLAGSLSWQALAVYSYSWRFTGYELSALLGFRALGVSYNTGNGIDAMGLNEVFYGPVVGASIRF